MTETMDTAESVQADAEPRPTTAEGFATLFAGREDAYGISAGGVRHDPVTPELYRSHLAGVEPGIGIFPMLPGDNVRFAAIDLDRPDFDLARLFAELIPGSSWIERSRSGNAHIWVFFNAPCPAWAARGVLKHVCEALGERTVEVFPKQERLLPGMVGNYINLPWFADDRPVVTAEDAPHRFEAASLDCFVPAALEARLDPEFMVRQAEARGIGPSVERETQGEFGEQPFLHHCAEHILANAETNPIQPGHRQAVIFHVAKQLLHWDQLDEDEAFGLIRELNDAAVEPLTSAELRTAFRNAASGKYRYTGCDDPLMSPYIHPDCPWGR